MKKHTAYGVMASVVIAALGVFTVCISARLLLNGPSWAQAEKASEVTATVVAPVNLNGLWVELPSGEKVVVAVSRGTAVPEQVQVYRFRGDGSWTYGPPPSSDASYTVSLVFLLVVGLCMVAGGIYLFIDDSRRSVRSQKMREEISAILGDLPSH